MAKILLAGVDPLFSRKLSELLAGHQLTSTESVEAPDLRSAQVSQAITSLRRRAVASGKMFEPIDVRINSDGTLGVI
ncbi:MAG: hypothetical protein ABSC36_06465, partial [Gaiellaceae bacterium]